MWHSLESNNMLGNVYYFELERTNGHFRAKTDEQALEIFKHRQDQYNQKPLVLYTDSDKGFRIIWEFEQ